jgi:murein L,D-transpeptidase YcbB/YkuD
MLALRIFRISLLLAALLVVPSVVARAQRPVAGESTAAPSSPLAVAIDGIIGSGRIARLRNADLRDVAADLRRLYPRDAAVPLWNVVAAGPVIDELARAAARGLDAEDYDAALLAGALRAPADSDAGRAWFDVALSTALLRYAAALHGGRVAASRRGFDAGASPPRLLDRAAVLREIAAGADAAITLAALEPRLSLYRDLKKALPLYRGMAERAAALPPLGDLGKLHPGDQGTDLRGLRALLALLGDLPNQPEAAPVADLYDGPLVEAVRRFQDRHGLDPDGVVGPQTTRALSVPLTRRVAQIELNLERLRWLPEPGSPLVIVNIPEFRLRAYHDAAAAPVLESKVIVGSAARKHETVAFAAEIRGVIFWPNWNVPRSITRNEQLPKIARDPGYVARQNMEIVAPSPTGGTRVMGATREAIEALRSGQARLRQRPGSGNALGRLKFVMPNRYTIYLHDTPSVGLFARSRRDFSHGCVRVERPLELADLVLAGIGDWDRSRIDAALAAKRTRHVTLAHGIPVWLFYLTAVAPGDGTLRFADDLYERDADLERALR